MPHVLLLGSLLTAQALTFAQALATADSVPALDAARRAERARASLAAEVSSLTYNPTLQVQSGLRDPSAGSGLLPEIYVSASQRFNAEGLSSARRSSLARQHAHDEAVIETTRRVARREVAEAWVARWLGQSGYATALAEIALIDQLVLGIEASLAAGEATLVDVAAARAFRAEIALHSLDLEGQTFDAGVALTRALGRDDPTPTAAEGDLPTSPALDPRRLAERHNLSAVPEVVAARAQQQVQQARLAETAAARGATYAVGAMAFREGGGDMAVLATLDVDLPFFERGERERAEVVADVALAEGRARETAVAAQAQWATALHEVEHTAQVLRVTEGDLLVAAESLADAQHKRWLAREATVQDWLIAQRALIHARLAVLQARARHGLALFLVTEQNETSEGNASR